MDTSGFQPISLLSRTIYRSVSRTILPFRNRLMVSQLIMPHISMFTELQSRLGLVNRFTHAVRYSVSMSPYTLPRLTSFVVCQSDDHWLLMKFRSAHNISSRRPHQTLNKPHIQQLNISVIKLNFALFYSFVFTIILWEKGRKYSHNIEMQTFLIKNLLIE